MKRFISSKLLAGAMISATSQAAPTLIGTGTLEMPTDLSGQTGLLENGLPGNNFGGIGSGLAWAGGNRFIAIPDRGPNATAYAGGELVDNTASYIARCQNLTIDLSAIPSGGLPYTVTPALASTTLLYSTTPLVYGATAGLPSAVPSANTLEKFFFTGRSDNFGAGLSTNPDFGRFDPEGVRVSRDGKSVFIADEYGPYVYQFDRATGARVRSYALPSYFAATNLSSVGATEIATNTVGRVTNKGMEGLAITPDGKTLAGFMQSPLAQDGGDGGRANRLVTIDIASGATHDYVFDNYLTTNKKTYNSSELLALNSHQFLVLERDGKGLGDGSKAVVKQIWSVDIAGATDVSSISGEAALLPLAAPKTLFLDIVAELKSKGFLDTQIPAKLEGIAFGNDIVDSGVVKHTLYLVNDNDFVPAVAGPNRVFVFAFTDADLAAKGLYLEHQVFNVAPSADAGANTVVASSQIGSTILTGIVSDEDGDAFSCRWFEGTTPLTAWTSPVNGTCPLNLTGSSFALGQHTLSLKATDSKDTTVDSTLLIVGNSAPTVTASGAGSYQVNTAIHLSGIVADFDGDNLQYAWTVDSATKCSGNISAFAGGAPVALTDCQIAGLDLGAHSAILSVNDGVNATVNTPVSI
ncbi:MAG: esterase-like activity of phytase family protein, partial [Fibrobacterota bacterium]